MRIIISKREPGDYTADLLDLPGSPPIGVGFSPEEAVVSLFGRICQLPNREDWLNCINHEEFEIIRLGF